MVTTNISQAITGTVTPWMASRRTPALFSISPMLRRTPLGKAHRIRDMGLASCSRGGAIIISRRCWDHVHEEEIAGVDVDGGEEGQNQGKNTQKVEQISGLSGGSVSSAPAQSPAAYQIQGGHQDDGYDDIEGRVPSVAGSR